MGTSRAEPNRRRRKLSPQAAADHLRERVYVTFTGLAVLLAIGAHDVDHLKPGRAALTVFLTVAGVLLAGFVADVIAHTVVHESPPPRAEFAELVRVTTGSLGAVGAPLLLIAAAGAGWMELGRAIRIGQAILIVTLVLIARHALHRVKLPVWQRLVLIGGVAAIGVLAVFLEMMAHTL